MPLLASCDHPLHILDIGTHAGAPYVVFELLDGHTLRDALAAPADRVADDPSSGAGRSDAREAGSIVTNTTLPRSKAMDYARQISLGLAAAHAKGITHRDIKSENVFITADGRVKILDFGLAALREDVGGSGATRLHNATAAGTVLGIVGYMSPEQVRGQQADGRFDIFSVGVVLFEMLAGRPPFRATRRPTR